MKLRIPFILLILGCCLGSCDYYFVPKGLDDGAKLYVQCIAANSDTTFINIQKAMGINTVGDIMPDVESVSLKVNGRESTIKKYVIPDLPEDFLYGTKDYDEPSFYPEFDYPYYTLKRYNIWYTDSPVKEGDDLSLTVKAKGMEEVSAKATVPRKVVIQGINAAPRCSTFTDFDTSYTEKYLSFDINIADASPDDYYGITVKLEQESTIYYDDGRTESYTSSGYGRIIDWNGSNSDIMAELQVNGGAWTDAYYNGYFIDSFGARNMKLVSGSFLKDGHLQFDCSILWSEDTDTTYAAYDGNTDTLIYGEMNIKRNARYKLLIYRVSPEFFRFNKAQYLLRNNYLAEYGLSPSTFSYSNINGGFGLLGGLSCTTTPWYQSPYEPEQ